MSFIVVPDTPTNRDGRSIGRQIRNEKTAAEAVAAYCEQMNCEGATVQGAENVPDTE